MLREVNALLTILHANPNRVLTIGCFVSGTMKYPILFAAAALCALPLIAPAQDAPAPPAATPPVDGGGAPPAPEPNGGGGGGRRGGTPEQFRQRMIERLKTSLKASDEEMTVIQPLVEKVFAKQREAAAGNRFGGGGGGPRPPRGGGDRPPGESPDGAGPERRNWRGGGGETPEAQALRDALDKDGTPPSEITAKLTALREQRKKAAAELASAREDLRKVLTVRQEAVLVQTGLLE